MIVAAVWLVLAMAGLEGAVLVNDAYCETRFDEAPYGCPLDVTNRWTGAIEPRCGS